MEIQFLCPMLMVFDMKTSLNFYVDILGFEVYQSAGEKDDMGWAWLMRGELNLMLNTQYEIPDRPTKPDPSRMLVHKDIILYLGCPDVDGAYRELLRKEIKVETPKVSYGMKQLYFRDPDGYGICFQWKNE